MSLNTMSLKLAVHRMRQQSDWLVACVVGETGAGSNTGWL